MDNHYKQVPLKGKDKEPAEFFQQLKDKKVVVVPTDKTNNYVMVNLDEFHGWVTNHLNKNAVEMKRKDIVRIHGETEAFATKIKPLLTKKGKGFLVRRLVIPATNFTTMFLKLGYLGIKQILHDNKVNHLRFTIIQASDLKERLDDLAVQRCDVTMMLLDIENMYPSVRLKLIQKALTYYSCNLSKDDKTTINECLDLIKFGMRSTLVQYHGKYYAYKSAAKCQVMGDEDVALAISAYEATFCANVIASYVFEMTEVMFMQT
eukprot:13717254-Ditylum_brightwellii.AAC.1